MHKLLLLLAVLLSAQSFSQTPSFLNQQIKLEKFKVPEKEELITTENGIDPDTYIIGQGDQFTAYAFNSQSIVFTGQVTLESDIFIPEVGLIKVGPVSLNKAKEIINNKLIEILKSKNTEFYISLTKLKSATFSISGSVVNSGTYTIRGNYRISDAIRKANVDTAFLDVPNTNLREVMLYTGKDTSKIDFFQYLFKNDLSSNPYVYPGVNIFIPFVTKRIKISGPITNGLVGEIPIKNGENLASILNLCLFDESADTSLILIKHAKSGEIVQTSYGKSTDIILEDFDQITISSKTEYPIFQSVTLKGEVVRPGDYMINNQSTSFKELLKLSGGITRNADYERAIVLRKKTNPTENIAETIKASQVSLNPEIQTSIMRLSFLKDYTVLHIKQISDSILLRESDIVYIPKKDPFVYVSGNVANPGAIRFVKGMTYKDCIYKSGGLLKSADKSKCYLLTIYPENIVDIKGTNNLVEGDIIVIPEKQRYKTFSQIIMPIVSAVLTSVSLFWTIYNN
jgi:protein involved in polysaccharide export with SLBB domain